MKDVLRQLLSKVSFKFSELFSLKTKSKTEVVTGFMAILELAKLKRIKIDQNKPFSEIDITSFSENAADSSYDDLDDNIKEF